jgi:fibronectin type 3 domain-containing protein
MTVVIVAAGLVLATCHNPPDPDPDSKNLRPATVTATALSSSSIRVSWDSVSGATSYNVYRRPVNIGIYTLAGSSTTTSYTDTGLSSSTTYYYYVCAVTSEGEGLQSSEASATTIRVNADTQLEGVYIGIISFAETANVHDIVRLDTEGRANLISQLNQSYNISSQSDTALFYAVHKVLANLTSGKTRYPADLNSVNVITFTDGIDNASTKMSKLTPIEKQTFSNDDAYATYLSRQISSRTIAGKPITAYSVGVMGSDVSNSTKFTNGLEKIASPGKSQSLTDFENLEKTFYDIAGSLQITQTTNTTFRMLTPLLENGAKVRMTFDITGSSSLEAESSSKYIEGVTTVTETGASVAYSFSNIRYAGGLASDQGAGPISGVLSEKGVSFAFTGVESYDPSIDESKAKQWLMRPNETVWQRNLEYSVTGATDIDIEPLSSIIYLTLDSGASLDMAQIEQIRRAAIAFINSLFAQLTGFMPSGVSATAPSSNYIIVSWNPVSDASSYKLYRSTSSDGEYFQLASPPSDSYWNTSLSPNTTYYYKVSAYSTSNSYWAENWEGPQSSYAFATTRVDRPSDVEAMAVDSSSIRISWSPVSGASGYKVYRSTSSSGTYNEIASPTNTPYIDTGLSPSIYYYKVSAYNDNGEGSQSSIVSATATSGSSGISDITYTTPELNYRPWKELSDGRRQSFDIGNNSTTTTIIKFTSESPNASIVIQLTVSSEKDHDWAFISQLDNYNATPQSGYYPNSLLSGEQSVTVIIPVRNPGQHHIDITYWKDNKTSVGSDCAWFKVIQ